MKAKSIKTTTVKEHINEFTTEYGRCVASVHNVTTDFNPLKKKQS